MGLSGNELSASVTLLILLCLESNHPYQLPSPSTLRMPFQVIQFSLNFRYYSTVRLLLTPRFPLRVAYRVAYPLQERQEFSQGNVSDLPRRVVRKHLGTIEGSQMLSPS